MMMTIDFVCCVYLGVAKAATFEELLEKELSNGKVHNLK
jgi:hypothetical protein